MAKFTLDYDPTIDYGVVEKILLERFPECSMSMAVFANCLQLKKNMFVYANVVIKQKPKQNQTIILVNGAMNSCAFYLFGVIIHYAIRGNFIKEVRETLQRDLQKKY